MSKYADALHKEDNGKVWWTEKTRGDLRGERVRDLPGPIVLQPQAPQGSVDGRISWGPAWDAIRKHWRWAAIFAASVMGTVLLVTLFTRPTYNPSARVEIDPPGAELFSLDGRGGADSSADYLETQAQNMQSDQLLLGVIRQIHLDQVPEFTEKSPLSRAISMVLSTIENVPSWLWGRKRSSDASAPSAAPQIPGEQGASVLGAFHSQLSVKRDTASRMVTVSFVSHDPVLAADVTNTLVRAFIERTYQTRHEAIMQSTEWLSRQLDDIRAKMDDSNRALAGFQQSSGIADVDENRSTFSEQMSELSRQKTQAQAERIQIESYLRRSRNGNEASLPQIQNNLVVQALTQKMSEVKAELSQTLAVYGKNHPNTKKLQNQLEELNSQIQLQRNAIVGQMETSYAAALSREHMIDGQIRGTSRELGQVARYTALKKEAQANTDLYNGLYARVKEAGITAASKSINIRIVDQARVLTSPTRPRPLVNLGLGLFVSLVGGLLLIFVRQAIDTRIHTVEDIRQLGISAVSMVPMLERPSRTSFNSILASPTRKAVLDGPAMFLLSEPGSEQSEALRGIQTAIMLSRPHNPPRLLLVASSLPGEGKSTVAINLALALAQQGRTCIIDADLRRPSISRALRVEQTLGLSDYLADSVLLESVLTPAPDVSALTVVVSGNIPSDPGRLVNSEKMRLLLKQLKSTYDFVVIDSCPILPYADGRALAPFVDGIIFVGRAGAITREAMSRSLELLQEVHSAPVLEVVLNGASMQSHAYGYGYKYSYRQDS